ncbi:MAG: hypothetical protein KDA60_05715 [Planctomycetales bacterium]|nr:hypothetical protein [Planctomycetales bacterium]
MTTNLMIDFSGASSTDVRSLVDSIPAVLSEPGTLASRESSFVQAFSTLQTSYGGYSRYRFLDYDGNGRLDAHDGELAVDAIMGQVQQDFAPYDVNVLRVDNTATAIQIAQGNPAHDTILLVNGSPSQATGTAPTDRNNRHDDVGTVGGSIGFAQRISDLQRDHGWDNTRAQFAFENALANEISHITSETFGLSDINREANPYARTIMTSTWGTRDYNFPDQAFVTTEGGIQNAHQYLTGVLGASKQAWAAVLEPGVLTVEGSSLDDTLKVYRSGRNGWTVLVKSTAWGYSAETTYYVEPDSSPDVNSLNPFNVSISRIVMRGNAGNDELAINSTFNVPVHAFGGSGVDVIRTGAGDDIIFGGDGNDILVGNSGDDIILGGNGVDTIFGGDGNDQIAGERDNDVLWGNSGHDVIYGGYSVEIALNVIQTRPDFLGDAFSSLLLGWNRLVEDGNDVVLGGSGNDWLFGGTGRNYVAGETGNDGILSLRANDEDLIGGPGADRFLLHKNTSADLHDVASIDARIRFRDSSGTGNGYRSAQWTVSDIRSVDKVFADLQRVVGSTAILKKANGDGLAFVRRSTPILPDDEAVAFNGGGTITLTNNNFSSMNWLTQVISHELGHNFDDENPNWTGFKALSGWVRGNPDLHVYTSSPDKDSGWSYLKVRGNDFVREYARFSPREDFACTFAAYFMDQLGRPYESENYVPENVSVKLQFMHTFVVGLTSPRVNSVELA